MDGEKTCDSRRRNSEKNRGSRISDENRLNHSKRLGHRSPSEQRMNKTSTDEIKQLDKKSQKILMKSMETPEEKRFRRLQKKESKEKKRKERMGWDEDYEQYTNTDNPFGDANLHQTFVWTKKLEKEGLTNMRPEAIELRNKTKLEENRVQLAKVKKQRLEREQERARKEDDIMQMQRVKESERFKEWETREDGFQLEQARLRSKIRIQDGRAKPIDLLAKYINIEDEDLAVEMHEPYKYLNGLNLDDLEDLLVDIKVYIELENEKNFDYWTDITVIVEDELVKLRKIVQNDHRGRREEINVAVGSDIMAVFKGKTHIQLIALRDQITSKIQSGGEGVDIGYWESLLSQLKAQISKVKLSDRHRANLRTKLMQLRHEQGVIESLKTEEFLSDTENIEPVIDESDREDGQYSPKLIHFGSLEPGTFLVEPDDDSERLKFARQKLIGNSSKIDDGKNGEEDKFRMQVRMDDDDDETVFSVEAALDQKMYVWADKYRPRKPRYYNRVHTGFEWNKYNQTHYDMENPPPKIVQGYKFNIFYPDLIDKSITPSYKLFPCEDDREFAVLRFYAGPPYEDIAFKIVNKEWDCSYKRGFKCQFSKDILQFWFHFKRLRYRR
uniref:Splicing factor Cactin n=1 Tax=Strigamia maritima TaxID=126957 RepID=T1IKV7_STRMM